MTDEPMVERLEGESLVNYAATVIKLQREYDALATEHQVMRRALEAIAEHTTDEDTHHMATAALPPVADERTEG